ncbi:MAG: dihydrofolate reductase [Acidobacteria bacterium]|nr:dihydrofolate reductase [Acidobacteriota bacterium]
MRRVRYGGAISLDGFIAGPEGQADWILMDPEIDFAALFSQYDTLLIGRRTFSAMVAAGHADPMPGITTYVFSRTLRQEDYPDVTIVSDDAGAVVQRLRAQPGKDIALYGGGNLFRSLLDLGQVDTVEVSLIPVLLGEGIPLLPPPYGRVQLKLTAHKVLKATGTISLEYAIPRSPRHDE